METSKLILNWTEYEFAAEWGWGWQPWADTICYYQFDNNLNDSSWNGRNLSMSTGSFTYWTESGWAKYVYMPIWAWSDYWSETINYSNTTVSFWRKWTSSSPTSWASAFLDIWASWSGLYLRGIRNIDISWWNWGSTYNYSIWTNRHYYVITHDDQWNIKIYLDGNTTPVHTDTTNIVGNYNIRFRLNQIGDTSSSQYSNDGYLSELIWESKIWTADEVAAFFNSTKSLYWIS